MDQAQGTADDRVRVGAVPARGVSVGASEPCAQHGDQQQVEEAVERGLLSLLVLADLGRQQRHER